MSWWPGPWLRAAPARPHRSRADDKGFQHAGRFRRFRSLPVSAGRVVSAGKRCGAFQAFYSDITTYTPHDIGRLIPDTQAVQAAAEGATGPKSAPLKRDAEALTAYVGSADFPANGNVLGAPIQQMQTDYP